MRKFVLVAVSVAVAGLFGYAPAAQDKKDKDPDIIVPFVPTNEKVVAAMLKLAAV
jgi:hypothetical protein